MEVLTALPEEINRPRCRLCFHAGENYQLVEVFTKYQDISKRVMSALGVKIYRSEKQARICTICESLIDIIQNFQAVCKKTNQLHQERKDFLLYDTFWDNHEQEAVKCTEKIILTHRSEVDKTISGTLIIPPFAKNVNERKDLAIEEKVRQHVPLDEKQTDFEEERVDHDQLMHKPEIVLCEPTINNDMLENECVPSKEFQSVFENQADVIEEDTYDLELKSESSTESNVSNESDPEWKSCRNKINSKKVTTKKSDNKFKVRQRRGNKINYNEPSDNDLDAKVPGKRGPRRKKVRKSDPSECDICGETVAYYLKESHRNQHLGVRPYKCDYEGCGRTYFSHNDIRTHIRRHEVTYHVCEICGRNIKGVEWFRRHVKTHTECPQFTCEVCGSKFRRKAQLQTHMVTHTGLTPHECKICGRRFALKYNMELHAKRHDRKEDLNQKKKNFTGKRTWKNYVKPDSSVKRYHVTCETCGKLVHKREIDGHVNRHLGRRPYSCDETGCTRSFYGLRGIKEHKMVVHSDKILRYECSICNRSIKGAGTFKRHVMLHNSDMKVECQYCGKKFTSKSYLRAHERKHSGVRPYICDICDRTFAMKPCWKMHMKKVHNEDWREHTAQKYSSSDMVQEVEAYNEILVPEQSAVSSTSLCSSISELNQEPRLIEPQYDILHPLKTDHTY
ncbi:zinc finger protein 26-like [Malaya genurostris]|uniref:zinc finger protein 26-like n=1 Tax=Malaya genurostris TaxID=325434 RepID=UPI0026F3AF1E|nr:zinc finger protein 26-like [Malaya genurostris]